MVGIKAFLAKAKHQNHASYREECVYLLCSINKGMEITMRIQVCPIWGTTLILKKIVERKAFLTKPKHQNHVFQWEKCVFVAKSWKERWLLHKSMFTVFKGWT